MDKKNYNFNIDPPEPSKEAIQKHQDFDALMEEFEALPQEVPEKNLGRRIIRLAAVGIAAAVAGLVFTYVSQPQNNSNDFNVEAKFASLPYVNPPIKKAQKAFEIKSTDINKGGTYFYENGTKVVVPPAAFVDENGDPVEGEINIHYKEYHDFVDFFLSGIPMDYDSAGTKYVLESAGMMEIFAEQNGKRLEVAPDKKIDIEMVSEIMVPAKNYGAAPQFNIYSLDTMKRNWVYEGVDDIEILNDPGAEMDESPEGIQTLLNTELAQIKETKKREEIKIENSVPKPIAPLKPERANGSDFAFDFSFDNSEEEISGINQEQTEALTDELNELNEANASIKDLKKIYEGTLWQVSPNNGEFNQEAVASINWEDMDIKPLNGRDYELTLTKGSNTMKVIVNPVLSGPDYEKALAEFNEAYLVYEESLAEREAILSEKKSELYERMALLDEAANKKYEEKIEAYKKMNRDDLASNELMKQKIINRFTVNKMGIWNCDRPLPPYIVQLQADFVDNSKSKLHGQPAFLVDKKRNTLKRFYSKKNLPFQFNDDADNLMWIITKENKLALAKPKAFASIDNKDNKHTFVMDVVDRELNSEEDIRSILQFN